MKITTKSQNEEELGSNLKILNRLDEKICALHNEIDECVRMKRKIKDNCNHDILVCFEEGDSLEDNETPKYYCLNCMNCYMAQVYFIPNSKDRIVHIEKHMDLFTDMSDYEIIKLVIEYFNMCYERMNGSTIEEVVREVNDNLVSGIEEIKVRSLENK